MKKVFYEKRGRRYYPVAEYDSDLMDALPKGSHVTIVYPGGQSTRYHIDPAYAPMIAAGRVAEDAISAAIVKATDLRPNRSPITPEQRSAWEALSKSFGEENHALQWPSAREAAERAVEAMITEAEKLMTNPAVKKAYEHFLLVCQLTKEKEMK